MTNNELTSDEQKLVLLWRSCPNAELEIRYKKGKISYCKEFTDDFISSIPIRNYDLLDPEISLLEQLRHIYFGTAKIHVENGVPVTLLADSYRTYIFSEGKLDIE